MGKIVICSGSLNVPTGFWWWAVCTEEEYIEKDLKKNGWVKSECIKYLTKAQLIYLNEV